MKKLLLLTIFGLLTEPAVAQVSIIAPPIQQQQVQLVPMQTGINGAAQQQQQALNSSANMNMMIGMVLLSSCMSKQPNMMMCMMGAMALAQSFNARNAANQAAATASQVSLVPVSAPVTVTSPTTIVTAQNIPPSALPGLKLLASKGYTVSSEGVTDSRGQSVQVPALDSPHGMAAAGMDPQTIAHVQRTVASVRTESARNEPRE